MAQIEIEIDDAEMAKLGERVKLAGVTEYIWSTTKDNRVRKEHQAREGKTFSYDNPPSDGNPGEPIRCRCVASPVFTDEMFGI
jgi:SPP1 gp7 family putative phage head morphogenesis protein